MTGVSVIVPWRPDGGPRDAAWELLQRWWVSAHPTWQLVVGEHLDGPWCKAAAVANALPQVTGDILIIADADVWTEGVDVAVDQVAAGHEPWAMPHGRVLRLTPEATTAVLAGAALPDIDVYHRGPHPQLEESYQGQIGGGMVVLPRHLYDRVPLDRRFQNYGQEDTSWGRALTVIAGPGRRGPAHLWHLHHPPQPRIASSRSVGSKASYALYQRYQATRYPPEMTALLAEAG